MPVAFAVGVGDCVPVPDAVRVRVPVCDGVAVLVRERVALAVTVAVPVIDSADDMVRVVVCDDVAAAVELAVLEMDREPENEWIDSSVLKSGTKPRQAASIFPSTSSLLSGSIFLSGHSCTSRAVGPRMRLPETHSQKSVA